MKDNVVELRCITKLPLDPNRVLRRALEAGMTECVVVGFTSDGEEYFASSVSDGGGALWHLARAQHRLLQLPDQES